MLNLILPLPHLRLVCFHLTLHVALSNPSCHVEGWGQWAMFSFCWSFLLPHFYAWITHDCSPLAVALPLHASPAVCSPSEVRPLAWSAPFQQCSSSFVPNNGWFHVSSLFLWRYFLLCFLIPPVTTALFWTGMNQVTGGSLALLRLWCKKMCLQQCQSLMKPAVTGPEPLRASSAEGIVQPPATQPAYQLHPVQCSCNRFATPPVWEWFCPWAWTLCQVTHAARYKMFMWVHFNQVFSMLDIQLVVLCHSTSSYHFPPPLFSYSAHSELKCNSFFGQHL